MKRLIASLLIASALSSPASASEVFYRSSKNVGLWAVAGFLGDASINPSCRAYMVWPDGSEVNIVKDLADGEFFIYIHTVGWNIQAEGIGTLRSNFMFSNGTVSGAEAKFLILNKNTIVIPNIDVEKSLESIMKASNVSFIMPGNIQDISINLTGSSQAMSNIAECIQKSKSAPIYSKPPTPPSSFKQNSI